jgi:hypothetical protein
MLTVNHPTARSALLAAMTGTPATHSPNAT